MKLDLALPHFGNTNALERKLAEVKASVVSLFEKIARRQRANSFEEKYLAQAQDRFDLEERMRRLQGPERDQLTPWYYGC